MRNPTIATIEPVEREARRPFAAALEQPEPHFAPLYTGLTQLVTTTVADELGRPLLGMFVPDGELL